MDRMRHLGLIGGLGPLATIHYYRELVNAQAGEMLLIHAEMKRVLAYVTSGDRIGLAGYFAGLIERMARGGAEVAAISAITPHICIRELEKISRLPLVDIIQEVGAEIAARGYRRVALFGTRFVVDGRPVASEWDPEAGTLRWRPRARPAAGTHHVEVEARDKMRNLARATSTFVIN